jgi:hypothetical protein
MVRLAEGVGGGQGYPGANMGTIERVRNLGEVKLKQQSKTRGECENWILARCR